MKIELGFGKKKIDFEIDDKNVIKVLRQNDFEPCPDEVAEVERAISNPIGTPLLENIVKPGEKVAIITSDITRPMPSSKVLPAVIDRLAKAGVKYGDITVVFALGNHRCHSEEEKIKLAGSEVYNKVKCIDSDRSNFVMAGYSSQGTPFEIFRPVFEADRRICLGNIEFHYFAGYSGGAKAIMPGVSTRNAIQANHSKMVLDAAKAGKLDGNPVREDIEEVAKFAPIDFIVNVVLDEKKRIVKAFAGHHVTAHREGCKFLDTLYSIDIPERADIVIVTPGGFPKDINLYQAQKALDNAKHAVKDGGIVIFVAECTEGLGEEVFERWIMEMTCVDDLIDRVCTCFELGGHKAAAIALVQKKADIYMVSALKDELLEKMFITPFKTVEQALDKALEVKGKDAGIIVMPVGGSTLPSVKNS
ncbi:MAG: nickel-dependent lactate racemase [Eubacteriales bacterium]|nr:nickel-dependent lactate racemase [Eubacteriales bacterium]